MEVIRGIYNVASRHSGCVATIGNFDGVHVGHQMLLQQLSEKAKQLKVPSTLITFEPQPREFFLGASVPARLTRFREKIALLKGSALDRVVCLPFNEQLANLSARYVIEDFLVARLGVAHVVVGDDFRFGKGAEGSYQMLEEKGRQLGFTASHLDTHKVQGIRVSSSRIRTLLAEGDIETAEKLLGHPYFIMGRVMYGRQLGRELGIPTANIRLQRYRAALEGVFAVRVEGLSRVYDGIANIGVRPTVDGKEPLLEVHIFDFDEDIYGELLKVTFLKKIRDEMKFKNLDKLKTQIEQDIREIRTWFELEHSLPGRN